jgi:hypothetical protein
VGKVFKDKVCCKCGKQGKVIEVFGKYYCKPCYKAKPKSGKKGHSGMIAGQPQHFTLAFNKGLNIEPTKKGDKTFCSIFLQHYPQSKGILGRQFNYFIKDSGEIIGIIGFTSPPRHYKLFDNVFGLDMEKHYLNNNVFCIIKNGVYQASQILALALKTVKKDYEKKWSDKIHGFVTFVEPPRTGIVYKASGWEYLGMTQGLKATKRSDLDTWTNKDWGKGTKKHIFVKAILRRKYQARDTQVNQT